MGHKFGIQGSCVVWDESNEKCATDQADAFEYSSG